MIRMRFVTKGILITALVLFCIAARPAAVRGQAADQGKTSYTIPEYNAFQAANAEKDPQARLKLLDDFSAKFPSSTLNQYVYALYYQTYLQLKNYPKTIEYVDKLTGLGDAADLGARLSAYSNRVQVFPFVFNPKAADAHDQLVKERDAAKQGADLLQKYPKPADSKLTDDQFAEQKKPGIALFDAAAGFADLQLKDFPASVDAFKTALADDPKDAVSAYRLGVAYLSETPPQSLDGFWYLARSINLKIQGDAQIKDYLREPCRSAIERVAYPRGHHWRSARHLYDSFRGRSAENCRSQHHAHRFQRSGCGRRQGETYLARSLRRAISQRGRQDYRGQAG
jgi:hypothetical protein